MCELIQRTNQFNTTTIRHSKANFRPCCKIQITPFTLLMPQTSSEKGVVAAVVVERHDVLMLPERPATYVGRF